MQRHGQLYPHAGPDRTPPLGAEEGCLLLLSPFFETPLGVCMLTRWLMSLLHAGSALDGFMRTLTLISHYPWALRPCMMHTFRRLHAD